MLADLAEQAALLHPPFAPRAEVVFEARLVLPAIVVIVAVELIDVPLAPRVIMGIIAARAAIVASDWPITAAFALAIPFAPGAVLRPRSTLVPRRAHAMLVAPPSLGIVIAEPGRDFIARALEKAAILGIAAVAATVAIPIAVAGAIAGPSRTLVAAVVAVICHDIPPS